MLRSWPDVDTLFLGSNAGHGVALDLAACAVRTSVMVTLDSDAVPLGRGWLDPVVVPVQEGRALLAGLRSSRDFAHPVFCAVSTRTFLQQRLSFQAFVPPGVDADTVRWGENAWDTAELLTRRLSPDDVVLVDATPNLVDGLPGMTTAGLVYHHGGVSRSSDGAVSDAAVVEWKQAIRALGLDVSLSAPRGATVPP